ncbi:MAG: hypothetical protein QG635_98 [Bacteroidota bacterium]|nr:hypothetical protein [Bacteroidota bacterium]
MKKALLFIFLMIFISESYSQDSLAPELRIRYGIFGNFNYNIHLADFKRLPDVPSCCPNFQLGLGPAYSAGLLLEIPFSYGFSTQIRAGYFVYDGLLTSTESTYLYNNGRSVDGEFEYRLDSKLAIVGLEPLLSFGIYDKLRLNIGINAGYLLTKTFEQYEQITKPEGSVTFLDSLGSDSGDRIRNRYSGDLKNASDFQAAALLGISYELPLNNSRSLLAAPEILAGYSFTPVVSGLSWNVLTLRAGVAIKYAPEKKKEIYVPPPPEEIFKKERKIDTIEIVLYEPGFDSLKIGKGYFVQDTVRNIYDNRIIINQLALRTDTLFRRNPPKIAADIAAFGLGDDGSEQRNPVFIIDEFPLIRLRPMLNYIFFEENSSELPSRYIKLTSIETKEFQEDKLYHLESLPIYYNIINIIGKRLTKFPKANLYLTGCNSDLGEERGNKELSLKRAQSLKDYLVKTWGIADNRLIIQPPRNLPEKYSRPYDNPDMIEENRRVELRSDFREVLAYVITTDTLRTGNPPILRFRLSCESDAGVSNWRIQTFQANIPLKEFNGNSTVPEIQDWKFADDQKNVPKTEDYLEFVLKIKDRFNQEFKTPIKKIPIEQQTIHNKENLTSVEKTVDNYSLILFDFDKAELSEDNKWFIDLIKSRLRPNSIVTVSGYTDRTGDEDYNLKLSERRALAAGKALGHSIKEINNYGEKQHLENNDLPEGRFYSRTVEIKVETPIER